VHGHHSVINLDQHNYDNTDMLLLLSYFSPQSGDTALHDASNKGHPEVVQILVQSHADVNVKNRVSTESPH
jgi:ankyrin repeat protein